MESLCDCQCLQMALAGIKGNSGSPASWGNKGESQVSVSEMRWSKEGGRGGGEASTEGAEREWKGEIYIEIDGVRIKGGEEK